MSARDLALLILCSVVEWQWERHLLPVSSLTTCSVLESWPHGHRPGELVMPLTSWSAGKTIELAVVLWMQVNLT